MARRDFRQLGLADSIVRRRGKKSEWLERLDAALDWPALEAIVAGIHASREGGLAGTVKLALARIEKQCPSSALWSHAAASAPVISAQIANACARTARYSVAGR